MNTKYKNIDMEDEQIKKLIIDAMDFAFKKTSDEFVEFLMSYGANKIIKIITTAAYNGEAPKIQFGLKELTHMGRVLPFTHIVTIKDATNGKNDSIADIPISTDTREEAKEMLEVITQTINGFVSSSLGVVDILGERTTTTDKYTDKEDKVEDDISNYEHFESEYKM